MLSTLGSSSGFNDGLKTHWATTRIKKLAVEGIAGGCDDGNYCPEKPVTSAQMTIFLVRTLELP
jgi:hypothetical protein